MGGALHASGVHWVGHVACAELMPSRTQALSAALARINAALLHGGSHACRRTEGRGDATRPQQVALLWMRSGSVIHA